VAVLKQQGHQVMSLRGRLINLSACSIQVDYVIHLAAALRNRPDALQTTNVEGTRSLLEALDGTTRLIFTSSRAVYGADPLLGCVNENARLSPIDEYGHSKVMGEKLIVASSHPYLILRSSVLFGHGIQMIAPSFISRMIIDVVAGRPLHVFGAADQLVDPLYVWDLAYHIAGFCSDQTQWNQIYNASGSSLTLAQVAETIANVAASMGLQPVIHMQPTTLQPNSITLDSTRLARASTYTPTKTFESIVSEIITYRLETAEQ
jgi:nucleoside-diphosphate-sugar epimerase